MTSSRVLLALRILAGAVLFGRLGGLAWLPPAPASAAVLLAILAYVAWRRAGGTLTSLHSREHAYAIALGMLILLATAVRLPSIGADLGHQPPDIDGHRLAASIRTFFVTGRIEHDTVEHYPGIVFWAMSASALASYVWGIMRGTIRGIELTTVEQFMLAGRLANVAFAAGIVACTAGMARRLSGRAAALTAATVVALAPLSIETTTDMRNDPGQVFLLVAAVLAALAATGVTATREAQMSSAIQEHTSEAGVQPALWIAGVCAGLAAGVKYTSVFVLVPVILAAIDAPAGRRLKRTCIAFAASAAAAAISNHFLWYDFPNLLRQLSEQVAITGPGHWAATANPSAMHRSVLATVGPGWPLLLAAVAWGVWTLATGRRAAWVFWSFPLLYSWFTTHRPSQFPRWVFPLLPFVAVAGACGLVASVRWLQRAAAPTDAPRLNARRWTAPIVLAAVALAPPVWNGLGVASRRVEPSTAVVLERWLAASVPPGQVVLAEQKWLDLDRSSFRVVRVPDLAWALGSGRAALETADWVVVPETHFANPGLSSLALLHTVTATQRSWFGHLGFDYRVYGVPKTSAVDALDVRLDDPATASMLGWEWPRAGRDPGLLVPDRSASIFLPPVGAPAAVLELNLANAGDPGSAAPLAVFVDDRRVPLAELAPPAGGKRRFGTRVELTRTGRSLAVRLDPVKHGARVRALAVRLTPAR